MRNDPKTEAKARGLNWRDVQDAFDMVRQQELDKREYSDTVRQAAWDMTTALEPHLGCYWRYGFAGSWARWPRLAERDYTAIANHDTIAQEVASHFPEYATDNGTERLFGELLAKHSPMPLPGEMYAMAMELVESSCASECELDSVPF